MRGRTLSAALAGWAVRLVNEKKGLRAVAHMRDFTMRRVIVKWSAMANAAVYFQVAGDKITRRVRHLVTARGFSALAHWAWQMKNLNAMESRWGYRQVVHAFSGWAGDEITLAVANISFLSHFTNLQRGVIVLTDIIFCSK